MKVLIGYDGSEQSDDVVADFARAGLPEETEALVVCVADVLVAMPYAAEAAGGLGVVAPVPIVIEEAQALARRVIEDAGCKAERGAERLSLQFPAWKVRSESPVGSPYWTLIKLAQDWSADLAVVGARSHGAIGRLLGSVSQNVLSYAPCSVRIARSRPRGVNEPLRILLAIDGSPDSALAVQAVCARRWPKRCEIRVVTVADLKLITAMQRDQGRDADHAGATGRAIAERRVKLVERELREGGHAATSDVLEGDPKRSIVQEAERWSADCVFLGARGHGRVKRILLGSVSATVAASAPCSVEVVRAESL
jgi:nucleotide-binding universal stress UspA family protein